MVQSQPTVTGQVTFTITEEQYLAAMRLHSRRQFRLMPLIFGMTVIAILITMAGSLITALGIMAIFAGYIALIMYVVRQSIRKAYRSLPQLHGEQTVQFSEDGLVWHNNYSLSKLKWPLYQKFAADESMYLLYQGPNIFNLVPRSAFHSEEQEDAFRMILELNVKPVSPSGRKSGRHEL